jgi:hypothetical protein
MWAFREAEARASFQRQSEEVYISYFHTIILAARICKGCGGFNLRLNRELLGRCPCRSIFV